MVPLLTMLAEAEPTGATATWFTAPLANAIALALDPVAWAASATPMVPLLVSVAEALPPTVATAVGKPPTVAPVTMCPFLQ